MNYLPRLNEALKEAAYHVLFCPSTNLKGRQQLHGKYEWNGKKEGILSLSFWFIPTFQYFRAAALAWFLLQVALNGNQFSQPLRNFSGFQRCCPQKPIDLSVTVHCAWWAVTMGLCTSWDFPLFVLGTLRVVLPPTRRPWQSRNFWRLSDTRAIFWILNQHEDRLIINKNSKATTW